MALGDTRAGGVEKVMNSAAHQQTRRARPVPDLPGPGTRTKTTGVCDAHSDDISVCERLRDLRFEQP
jgi:hypothetical protein